VLRGQDALRIQPGESVLVVGAGPIGIMHILLARLRGAGKVFVSEVNPQRLIQAEDFDVDRAINPMEENLPAIIAEETAGRGVDVVIVAAPAPRAQEQAVELAAIGGRINFFGGLPKDTPMITLDSNLVHYKELIVTGTTACSTDDCRRAAEIVNTGRIDLSKLIGARFPLKEAVAAFQVMEKGEALKVILEP
jgi:L-iditol 2-dehydrogenase